MNDASAVRGADRVHLLLAEHGIPTAALSPDDDLISTGVVDSLTFVAFLAQMIAESPSDVDAETVLLGGPRSINRLGRIFFP